MQIMFVGAVFSSILRMKHGAPQRQLPAQGRRLYFFIYYVLPGMLRHAMDGIPFFIQVILMYITLFNYKIPLSGQEHIF